VFVLKIHTKHSISHQFTAFLAVIAVIEIGLNYLNFISYRVFFNIEDITFFFLL